MSILALRSTKQTTCHTNVKDFTSCKELMSMVSHLFHNPKKATAKHKTATRYLTHPWNLPPPGFPNLAGLAINTGLRYCEEL